VTVAHVGEGQGELVASLPGYARASHHSAETIVVDAIPQGYRTITPYLLVTGVPALLEFLKKALDATVLKTEVRDDGSIMHAEVRIGNSMLMTGEASADFAPMPASIYLYVEDCDAVYQRALNAGGSRSHNPKNASRP
jgi:PhnB protein